MGVSFESIVVVLVLVGVPCWTFRHDVVARLRGSAYITHLDERIRTLQRAVIFMRVKGSPEWVRDRVMAYAGCVLLNAMLNTGFWLTKLVTPRNAVVNVLLCAAVALALGGMQVWHARAKYVSGTRQIEPARGWFSLRKLRRLAQARTKPG